MKIRTINDLQDAIDGEMAWRKRELSAIKGNINQARLFAKDTALRSGIALLYAHWEGSVKNIASYYLSYVSNQYLPYNKLKNNFLAISIKEKLSQFEETSKTTLQTSIINEIFDSIGKRSHIPQEGIIKTNSNLNSKIFMEIMATIGLDCTQYESSYNLLDEVLLNMRNKIAHGERIETLSLDEDRYNEIHRKVLELMNLFATQISNAAAMKEYLNITVENI
ncbi:MAG: MAE_28990/MAE_18760 family HEPN-like nuclease [Sedimentibacter sp.]